MLFCLESNKSIDVSETWGPPSTAPDDSLVEGTAHTLYPAIGTSVNWETIVSPYDFPGMGKVKNDYCGTVLRGAACSQDPGHWSRPHPVRCDRLSCPVCWSGAVRKISRRASDRFRTFLDAVGSLPLTLDLSPEKAGPLKQMKRQAGRPLHLMYSPPFDTYSPDTPLDRIWKDGYKVMKASGLLAGYVVFHPARVKKGIQDALRDLNRRLKASGEPTKPFWEHIHADALGLGDVHAYAYWSPHFHAIGIGYLVNSKVFHQDTGWIYKNKQPAGISLDIEWNPGENRFDDQIEKVLRYLLSHAAYVPGKRALRTFGHLNPKHVKRVGNEFVKLCHDAVCPVCGSPVIHYWYRDDKPDEPATDIEGEHRPVACRLCGYKYEFRL